MKHGSLKKNVSQKPIHSRRGAATRSGSTFIAKVLSDMHHDQNLVYLASRLQAYNDACATRLVSLKQAISSGDAALAQSVAHSLTEYTARLGAIPMMKLCIALQMLARRGLLAKAREIVDELDIEFERFQANLIPHVG